MIENTKNAYEITQLKFKNPVLLTKNLKQIQSFNTLKHIKKQTRIKRRQIKPNMFQSTAIAS